jgi:hypothetical protein
MEDKVKEKVALGSISGYNDLVYETQVLRVVDDSHFATTNKDGNRSGQCRVFYQPLFSIRNTSLVLSQFNRIKLSRKFYLL